MCPEEMCMFCDICLNKIEIYRTLRDIAQFQIHACCWITIAPLRCKKQQAIFFICNMTYCSQDVPIYRAVISGIESRCILRSIIICPIWISFGFNSVSKTNLVDDNLIHYISVTFFRFQYTTTR